MEKKVSKRYIFSARVAKSIIRDGRFADNLIDIEPNGKDTSRTVFVFLEDEEFMKYISDEFNIV